MPNLTVDPQSDPIISNDHITVTPPPNNLPKAIILGLTLFILLSITAYGAYWYTKSYLVIPASQPTLSNVPSEVSPTKNSFESLNNRSTPPAIDETANWKTYTNIKYGYELRYPSNWAVKEFGKLDPKTVDFVAFNPEVIKNEFSAVTISFSTRTYEQSLELGVQKSEPIKIDSIDGAKKIEADPNGNKFIYVIFPSGQNTVTLMVKSEYEKLFDQILPTFKFL